MMMPEEKGQKKSSYAEAVRKAHSQNMASMSKGFVAVHPKSYDLEEPMMDVHYPEFSLKLKDIPEAKNWEVGKRYKLELIVEQVSMSDRKGREPDVEFSIVGIKAGGPASNSKKDNPGKDKEY